MWERAKYYWEEHKVLCTAIGAGVVGAGIAALIMRGRYEALANGGAYGSKTIDTSITMRPLSFLSKQDNVVNVMARNGRGHPGYIIHALNTDEYFGSQREAALVFNISENLLSKHLNGKLPNVEGYQFERLQFAA